MSVEFNSQGFPGWFQDDPNKPTVLRANVTTLRSKSGGIAPIVAEINYADGSIQYYEVRGGIGFNGPRIPLFLQSASGARTVQNQGNLNDLRPEDIARVESSVKDVAFRANQSLASADKQRTLRDSPYYRSLGNAAPIAPQGDQQGGNQQPSQGGGNSTAADGTSGGTPESSVLPGPSQPLDTNPTIADPREILSIPASGIRYPLRMLGDQDKIKFIACEIEKKTGLDGEPVYAPKNGPIFLAIQSPISDQNGVDWGPDSVNPIDAELFNLAKTVITPGNPFGKATEDQIKSMYSKLMMSSDRIQTYLTGQAASVNNAVARIDRAILNPNLELLFQGPQLRPFSFQFKMTAREPDEAVAIKKIIKYFKYHMAVRKENNNLFLRAPYVFTIQYLKGMEPKHPGINLISPEDNKKACALTNCSVDYTPLGTYMTNIDDSNPEKNGTMVSYTLSLQFQEITPIYDTDYKDYPHPIGF